MSNSAATVDAQEIRADTLYAARELRRRFSIGELSWRQLKKGGLRVPRLGKTPVVLGSDLIAYLAAQADGGTP
jgi:hypothetical protein